MGIYWLNGYTFHLNTRLRDHPSRYLMTSRYSTDIVIFGGGVAGLWLLNRLRKAGYHAILFEKDQLGSGQTLASQGIIHGGLKYALNGVLGGAANTIASMPQRWRQCLAGTDAVDLRGTQILSDQYYMWSNSGVRSRLKTFLGSKSLRGRVEALDSSEYPKFFQQATVKGSLYKLPDFVVATESLLSILKRGHEDHIFKAPDADFTYQRDTKNNIISVGVPTSSGEVFIQFKKAIFAAGSGNQHLIQQSKLQTVTSQLRPLNMIFVKGAHLPPIYVHCIGDSFNLTPKLTLTSHQDAEGQTVWYLGGEIAESGVGKTKAEQLQAARRLLVELFPWLNLEGTEWDCFSIDRAEPAIKSNFRPDDAYLTEESNVIVTWPTKLTLAPALGDKAINHLQETAIEPSATTDTTALAKLLSQPVLGTAQWN